ncbi:hypothetical protein F5Y18DRAFT_439123 [Xylariaceae sp. FL1019]|nr:hypothetical protein F5Y18DRAFT_439123 [Xylariaceae sp. FL1019]
MAPLIDRVANSSRLGRDHRWGFYVYRTTFDDQEIWERYMNYIHNAVTTHIQNPSYCRGMDPEVVRKCHSSFQFVTKEDKSLEGLTYDQVREIFHQWIVTGDAENDWGSGYNMRNVMEAEADSAIQYWYFVYVDKDILEGFRQIDDGRAEKNEPVDYDKENVALMIVADHPTVPSDEEDEDWGESEDEDAGKEWQFV